MAQEIMVMGAIYEDVPSVRLPDSNGTFHPFTDTSDTTAVAGDVGQGKTFHLADGTLATGTASGGGGGGGSADPKDVNFIDYDGTIVHSYTKDEFLALTAMPENPTHAGLVSQGWNWSLADAQEYVAECGMLVVGQMYVTESGGTEIDVELRGNFLSPYLSVSVNGQVTVYWGDGASTVVTHTSTYTPKYVQHTYGEAGRYTIRMHLDSGTQSIYNSETNFILSANSSTANENKPYSHSVRAVRVGDGVEALGDYAFASCANLEYVTLPNTLTSMGNRAFSDCYSIEAITIPTSCSIYSQYGFQYCDSMKYASLGKKVYSSPHLFQNCSSLKMANVTSSEIWQYEFSGCYVIGRVSVPSNVSKINSGAFFNTHSLREIRFKRETPATSGGFFNDNTINRLLTIYVPQGSLAAYTSASSYPAPATYTYVEE